MLERLQLFIQQKNLLPKYQAGFRKGRSVTDHTVKLGEHMRRALARKRVMLSCFFDIARAFDTVWHGKLLYQLKQAGISPSLYRFINSFLTGHTMAVRWKKYHFTKEDDWHWSATGIRHRPYALHPYASRRGQRPRKGHHLNSLCWRLSHLEVYHSQAAEQKWPTAEIGPENLPKRGEHHGSLPHGQRVYVVSPKDCLHACDAKGSELTRQPANRRPRDTRERIPFRALPRGHLPM